MGDKNPDPQRSESQLDADLSLATFHNDKFLLRGGSGEDDFSVVFQHIVEVLRGHFFQLATVHDAGLGIPGEKITAAVVIPRPVSERTTEA